MQLPTGTVTFVFTDIEGSTRLLQALGDAYPALLADHDRIVREAIARNEGIEIRTEGDAFFCVFTSPSSALAAAVEVQRRLAAHEWPEGRNVRVRIGVHTGEGKLGGDDYIGLDVNRASRIADAGHGGQVLVSEATKAIAGGSLPGGVSIVDLGKHRLEDLDEPEHLFQLVIEGLDNEFPPLRTLDAVPNNLRHDLTTFHGRREELEQAIGLLADHRLVTLTGPGGTGKTRLALQIGSQLLSSYPDGVWFVDLAPVTNPELVPSAIADVLSLHTTGPPLDAIVAHLQDRQTLLILDNFEQILPAATSVARLLKHAPSLRILVTSRAPLRIGGERELPIPPLPVPPEDEDPERISAFPSVSLFLERAMSVRPDFSLTPQNARSVATLASRLDGLPLALELAAARVRLLSPSAILERMGERSFELLAGGARDLPDRQQTLQKAIAWSHDLLDEPSQRLFRRLSVFRGGASLEDLEAICEMQDDLLDPLTNLVDQSLVRQSPGIAGPRFRMLETIREFAASKLDESGEADVFARRHAEVFLALAERAAPELTGWSRKEWLDRLGEEVDNLRGALDWALRAGESETAMRLTASLWRFWHMRGHLHEASEKVPRVLAMQGASPRVRAAALEAAGGLAHWSGRAKDAYRYYDEALRLVEAEGDEAAIANALYNRVFGQVAPTDSDLEGAERDALRSLEIARRLGLSKTEANALWALGNVRSFESRWAEALDYFEQAEEVYRQEDDPFGMGWTEFELGAVLRELGRLGEAREHLEEGLQIFARVDDLSGVVLHLSALALLLLKEGHDEDAAILLGATMRASDRAGTGILELVTVPFGGLAAFEERLGSERTQALLEEGRQMDLEQAMAYALRGNASTGS